MGDTATSLPWASVLGPCCFLKEVLGTIPEAHPQDSQKPSLPGGFKPAFCPTTSLPAGYCELIFFIKPIITFQPASLRIL